MHRLPNILRTFGFLTLLLMWIPFCLMFFSLPAGQINFEDPETIVRSLFSSGALFSGFGLLTIGLFFASIALQVAASASFQWMRQRAKSHGEAVTANIVKVDYANSTNSVVYRNVTFHLEINYKGEIVATRMKEILHRQRASHFRMTAKTVNVKFDPQTKVAVINE